MRLIDLLAIRDGLSALLEFHEVHDAGGTATCTNEIRTKILQQHNSSTVFNSFLVWPAATTPQPGSGMKLRRKDFAAYGRTNVPPERGICDMVW